jgi:hypothetical protein
VEVRSGLFQTNLEREAVYLIITGASSAAGIQGMDFDSSFECFQIVLGRISTAEFSSAFDVVGNLSIFTSSGGIDVAK